MKGLTLAAVVVLGSAGYATAAAEEAEPVAALPLVSWTKFVDPVEGAFSLEVPRGWNNVGGTVRRNALQVFGYETTASPDGNTVLTISDPNIVSYVVPTSGLAAAGIGVGSIYDGGGGTRYVVAPYQSGQEFATYYGQQVLPGFCTNVQLLASAPRPDLGREYNRYYQAAGMAVDPGEASFSCSKDGMMRTAYVLVALSSIRGPTGMIWNPLPLFGFLAPSTLVGTVAGMFVHMISSQQINPQWLARQAQINMDVSRIAARTQAAVSASIMARYEKREAAIDRIMDEGSRARLGIDYYVDPATGQQYVVANTQNYYWTDAQGHIVGTPTDTPPGPGYRRLQRVPPG